MWAVSLAQNMDGKKHHPKQRAEIERIKRSSAAKRSFLPAGDMPALDVWSDPSISLRSLYFSAKDTCGLCLVDD